MKGNARTNIQPFWRVRPVGHHASWVLFVWRAPRPSAAGVGVADVQPKGAVIFQHAPNFAEHVHKVRDVVIKERLRADLAGMIVVAQTPIRWRRNAGLEGVVRKIFQLVHRVRDINGYPTSAATQSF